MKFKNDLDTKLVILCNQQWTIFIHKGVRCLAGPIKTISFRRERSGCMVGVLALVLRGVAGGLRGLLRTLPRGVPALRGTLPRGVPAVSVPDALSAPVVK